MDVGPDAKRAAVVALYMGPWTRGQIEKIGTCHFAVVIPAAVVRPHVASISRQHYEAIFH